MNLRMLFMGLSFVVTCAAPALGQPRNAPIGVLPTLYNGGFAGESGATRIANYSYLQKRSEAYSAMPEYTTSGGTFISIDHFFKKLSSGVALTGGWESYSGISKGFHVSTAISPKFSFKGKYTFAPFVDASYSRFHTRWRSPDPDFHWAYPSNYISHCLEIGTGFLFNSRRAYFGMTTNILSYATTFYSMREEWSAFKSQNFVLQAGYTFQRTPKSKFSFTPQMALSYAGYKLYDSLAQERYRVKMISLVDVNLMFRYEKFIVGINYHGITLGYQTDKLKLILTNFYSKKQRLGDSKKIGDHTYFNTRADWEFSHTYTGSISLRYLLKKKESVKMPGFN